MYGFGTGTMWGVRSDVANSTPKKFGALQDVSVDFAFNAKELFGQFQFPLSIARGQGKITCKAKFAELNGRQMNDLFFAQAAGAGGFSSGQVQTANDEAGTIPTTPFQVTVVNTATFVQDLGVRNVLTGLPYIKVAAAPATGQYSVSGAGVYTFAAADTGLGVLISYTFTVPSVGSKIIINNQLLGAAPYFSVAWTETYESKVFNCQLNKCIAAKLALPFKQEDFTISEFDFSAMADAANIIGTISLAE